MKMSTFVEVYGEMEEIKVEMDLKVRVFNDGENVFEGIVKEFLEINQYDGSAIDIVNGLDGKSMHKEYEISGEWVIVRL
jgi:hypothetical protein